LVLLQEVLIELCNSLKRQDSAIGAVKNRGNVVRLPEWAREFSSPKRTVGNIPFRIQWAKGTLSFEVKRMESTADH